MYFCTFDQARCQVTVVDLSPSVHTHGASVSSSGRWSFDTHTSAATSTVSMALRSETHKCLWIVGQEKVLPNVFCSLTRIKPNDTRQLLSRIEAVRRAASTSITSDLHVHWFGATPDLISEPSPARNSEPNRGLRQDGNKARHDPAVAIAHGWPSHTTPHHCLWT